MARAERDKESLPEIQGVDVPALPGRVAGGGMNWMTSGRKRVQRSQKVKELRAKHFAKVAADRARAPVSRPGRASSSALNQSADVSRLKSRWTQQLPSTHKVSTLQRTVAGSVAAEHTTAENPTSPPSNVTTLGPGTTPDFQPGTLDLEVTPPFNATVRQQQGSNGMARIPAAALPTDGPRRGSSDDHEFERPLRHHPRQQRPTASFRGGGLLLPTQPDDWPPRHTLLPLERRQLVFGGGGGTAEQQDFGNSYEEQPIGSECAGIGDGVSNLSGPRVEEDRYQRGHALPGDSSAGTAGAPADSDGTNADDHNRTPRVMGQLGRASHPAEHTMRFFNDGFAVAQDGSPVVDGPLTATSSATTTVAASSVGGLVFPTNDYDNNRDTTGTQFGVRESGNAGGLPRFSIARGLRDGNRSSPPATPAGLWKENMPSDYRGNRQYALESSASDCGPDFSGQTPAEEQVQPRGRHREDGSEVHHRSQGECDSGLEQGPMLDHEDMMNPPPRDATPPAFDMLARTWGLFGGALDARTPTAFDASGSNSVKSRDTSEERAVREASFRHDRDGKTGAPPLHASVPVRATPQAVVGQDQSPEPNDANAEHPDAFESLQSPPPPSTPTPAKDYDRGCEDGGGSPELMMHFCQGPDLEVVVTGSQTDAEALEGEPNNSSQPTEDDIPVTAGDTQNTPELQHEASMEMLVSPQPADPKVEHNQEEGERLSRQADLNTFTTSQGPKSVAADERDVAPLPANGGDAPTEPGGSGGIGGGGGSVGEDGSSIKTVSQDVMPPGDLQLRPGRSSTSNGSQSRAGHEAASAKPSSSPHPSAAVPSAEVPSASHGQERKRARDAGEEEEGNVQGHDHPSEADSKLPVRNGGGGFRVARLSGKARRLQLEVMKAPTCGSGERQGEVGDGNARQGRMERDAGSTIVWYQTIVACLAAPP